MYYEITDSIKEIALTDVTDAHVCVGVLSVDEYKRDFEKFNFSEITYEQCVKEYKSSRNSIDRYEDYYFGMLNILDYDNVFEDRGRLAFYIRKNFLILVKIVDKNNLIEDIIADVFARFSPEKYNFERLIYALLDRVMNKDKNKAEYYDKSIETFEERVNNDDTSKDIGTKIGTTKKILLTIKKYYDQLADIGEILVENELGVFNHKQHAAIELFATKANRQSANIQQLIDNLTQVRESYQSLLDHSINQLMKTFTIISAIFMPLTLLVGWYGMNFTTMPELSWDYGYVTIIVAAFFIVIGLFAFFKKKKYF